MKRALSILLVLALCLSLGVTAFADDDMDYSGYTIRIYSNSNSTERTTWLIQEAKEAGFTISIDDNSVISGDSAAIQAANEKKDGDLIFGLNETRWGQLIGGEYENLSIIDWTPSWADQVGDFKYDGKAYGIVIQNVLMLYRNDEFGTNGEELHFDHWAAAPPTPISTPRFSIRLPILLPRLAVFLSTAGRHCGSSAPAASLAEMTGNTVLIL